MGLKHVVINPRRAGKSHMTRIMDLYNRWRRMTNNLEMVWEQIGKNQLRAKINTAPQYFDIASESDMDAIQEWCVAHNCGIRTSFDTFKFRSKKEMTMFLLKWS